MKNIPHIMQMFYNVVISGQSSLTNAIRLKTLFYSQSGDAMCTNYLALMYSLFDVTAPT